MSSFASRIRWPFQEVSRFAIAGLAAILLGLPSAAGATFLRSAGTAWGEASSQRDFSLALRDLQTEFVERAARDFDCGTPQLPSLAESFGHGAFGGPVGGDHATPPWLDGFGRDHHRFSAALHFRHFCPVKPPPEIPEPDTGILLTGGLVALSLWRRRRHS